MKDEETEINNCKKTKQKHEISAHMSALAVCIIFSFLFMMCTQCVLRDGSSRSNHRRC